MVRTKEEALGIRITIGMEKVGIQTTGTKATGINSGTLKVKYL